MEDVFTLTLAIEKRQEIMGGKVSVWKKKKNKCILANLWPTPTSDADESGICETVPVK